MNLSSINYIPIPKQDRHLFTSPIAIGKMKTQFECSNASSNTTPYTSNTDSFFFECSSNRMFFHVGDVSFCGSLATHHRHRIQMRNDVCSLRNSFFILFEGNVRNNKNLPYFSDCRSIFHFPFPFHPKEVWQ